ncbi:MAG: ornithine cyclodeaminase family protein [Gammaproteobacteria bacterium]|nr:ornithine cyclodeaminase family protein [Gammaproteobacteria bacterium]
MHLISAEQLDAIFSWHRLINCLREAFRGDTVTPARHQHTITLPDQPDATLLLLPAWRPGLIAGIKVVSVFPGNAERGLPAIDGIYYLIDGRTGESLAVIDGARLTLWKTAAASALAASYLARKDVDELLIVGTGKLAPFLARAHCSIRNFRRVRIWGRNPEKSARVAEALAGLAPRVEHVIDLENAARGAGLISCATLATEPLIGGRWLSPGTHLDLVGGFTPLMREADDEAIRRGAVFLDTPEAGEKAGDIVQPLESGMLAPSDIAADLFDLCRGDHKGRADAEQITVFKSAGSALLDLAAARLAFEGVVR